MDCTRCAASKIPLRGQLVLLLAICALVFLIAAPVTIAEFKGNLGMSFEHDFAVGNLQRGIAALEKVLSHEEEMLVSDAVWDAMADASIEMLETNASEHFYEFFVYNKFTYGHWTDWACGSMFAVFNLDSNGDPYLVWSEFHALNPQTYEIDIDHISPTPKIFLGKTEESLKFLRQVITFNTTLGVIAVDEGVFSVGCHAITHVDPNDPPHGYLCRVRDIRRFLLNVGSGSGACVSIYNMADKNTPKEIRDTFSDIEAGHRTSDSKYHGQYKLESVFTEEWNSPSYPVRMCGPAEMLIANSTKRTLLRFQMQSDFGVDDGKGKQCGYAFVMDNAQELHPYIDSQFRLLAIYFVVAGFIVFVVYGTFTELKVLRALNTISQMTYVAFVKNDEEFNQYLGSKKAKMAGQNEIIQMASMAAQGFSKSMKEYQKRNNELALEKLQSSLDADKLRLLSLWCCRSEPFALGNSCDDAAAKARSKVKRRTGVAADDSMVVKDSVSFDRVLSDSFAIEMFKNMAIEDPDTGFTKHPAQRPLLFLLSVLFYRSLSDSTPAEFRLDCIQGILDEFFDTPDLSDFSQGPSPPGSPHLGPPRNSSPGSPRFGPHRNDSPGTPTINLKRASADDDGLGIPYSETNKLILECSKCLSTRRPNKTLFDEAANCVRQHLKRDLYPLFVKCPEFLIVRIVFAEKSKVNQRDVVVADAEEVTPKASDTRHRRGVSDSVSDMTMNSSASKISEYVNSTEGTLLSQKGFNYLSAALF